MQLKERNWSLLQVKNWQKWKIQIFDTHVKKKNVQSLALTGNFADKNKKKNQL